MLEVFGNDIVSEVIDIGNDDGFAIIAPMNSGGVFRFVEDLCKL